MKNIITAIILLAFTINIKSQCSFSVYECASDNENAIYLSNFDIKLKYNKKEKTGNKWPIILAKGIRYRFNICTIDGFQDKVIMSLYDKTHPEETPLSSTNISKTNTDIKMFDFVCRKSGTYYISIRYKDYKGRKKACAVGVVSFVKLK